MDRTTKPRRMLVMRRISVRVVLAFVTRLWDTHDLPSADTQFAFGLTFPTPATFWSTGGSPPFIPDVLTPTDSNEPYLNVMNSVLRLSDSCIDRVHGLAVAGLRLGPERHPADHLDQLRR